MGLGKEGRQESSSKEVTDFGYADFVPIACVSAIFETVVFISPCLEHGLSAQLVLTLTYYPFLCLVLLVGAFKNDFIIDTDTGRIKGRNGRWRWLGQVASAATSGSGEMWGHPL